MADKGPAVMDAVNETEIIQKITDALKRIQYMRIGITIFLLSWLAVMSYLMLIRYKTIDDIGKPVEEEPEKPAPKPAPKKEPKKCPRYKRFLRFFKRYENFQAEEDTIKSATDKDFQRVRNLYYLHSVWFGDQSIVEMLFKIWFLAVLILNFTPVLIEIVKYIGQKTDIEVLKSVK